MPRKNYGAQNKKKLLRKLPRMPNNLRPVERKIYKEIGGLLVDLELICELHYPLLLELCYWEQVAADASAECAKRGSGLFDDIAGRKWADLRQKAFENGIKIKRQFGLTPSGLNQFNENTSSGSEAMRDKQSVGSFLNNAKKYSATDKKKEHRKNKGRSKSS